MRKSDILAVLKTVTIQAGQPEKCLRCAYGTLADIMSDKSGPGRAVLCTKGIQDYQFCIFNLENVTNDNNNQCLQSNDAKVSCHNTI